LKGIKALFYSQLVDFLWVQMEGAEIITCQCNDLWSS